MNKLQFNIVKADSIEDLIIAVNEEIALGWSPHGTVFIEGEWLCQAMMNNTGGMAVLYEQHGAIPNNFGSGAVH